jgi:hypothetical protein
VKPVTIVGWAMILIGGVDLAFGNTGQSPLPAVITNQLSQQADLVLLAIGAFLVFKM